jgi:hypothetical protein
VLAEVAQAVAGQVMSRLADEHLPTVTGSRDPGRTVHVHTDVALVGDERLAGVQSDPDLDRPVERLLGLRRRRERIGSTRKGDEEGVPLRVDFNAAVGGERLAQQPSVLGESVGVGVAELVKQPRRPLDVREQEGDGAAG